jgi:hypothetical protein
VADSAPLITRTSEQSCIWVHSKISVLVVFSVSVAVVVLQNQCIWVHSKISVFCKTTTSRNPRTQLCSLRAIDSPLLLRHPQQRVAQLPNSSCLTPTTC